MNSSLLSYLTIGNIADYSAKFSTISKDKNIFIICDQNTYTCVKYLKSNIKELSNALICKVNYGEENKNLKTTQIIWNFLLKHNANRADLIVNVGGGMITDLGGFVASTYKRGISYVNIPTSLLGMIDASIGGKTGINYNHYKNQIGTFSNPQMVICDPYFLESLPKEELLSGFAEALKHGLIYNKEYWELCLSKPIDKLPISTIISESIRIKNKITSIDPFEKKERKLLNLGHTIGHALESLLLEKKTPTLHGYAVANGIVIESYIASEINILSKSCFNEVKNAIYKIYEPIEFTKSEISKLIDLIKKDKKNTSDSINFTLLEDIGSAKVNEAISVKNVQLYLESYLNKS